MQRAPDFIDGHQHVHQFPQIRDALVAELQHRYPNHPTLWLRSTRYYAKAKPADSAVLAARQRTSTDRSYRGKALIIERLGARALEHKVAGRWPMSRALAGVYDFRGGEAVYAQLLAHWLATMQAGDVLMCHPASQPMAHDPLGAQRLAEYRVLVATVTL